MNRQEREARHKKLDDLFGTGEYYPYYGRSWDIENIKGEDISVVTEDIAFFAHTHILENLSIDGDTPLQGFLEGMRFILEELEEVLSLDTETIDAVIEGVSYRLEESFEDED